MSYSIAICGKGGTGKTTLTGLIINWLLNKHSQDSILAVDADPNTNLDQILGLKAENSIVAIVDEIAKDPGQIPAGLTKDRFLEYRIQDSLVEADGFDLLTMGRPEGPGCYCFVNNLLRTLIDKLSKSYSHMVVDNEAGMEHLSRRTTRKMDLLLIVSDYNVVGLRAAQRILTLTKQLNLDVRKARLIVNRAPQEIRALKSEIEGIGVPLAGIVPEDTELLKLSVDSQDVRSLSLKSESVKAVNKICEEVINNGR